MRQSALEEYKFDPIDVGKLLKDFKLEMYMVIFCLFVFNWTSDAVILLSSWHIIIIGPWKVPLLFLLISKLHPILCSPISNYSLYLMYIILFVCVLTKCVLLYCCTYVLHISLFNFFPLNTLFLDPFMLLCGYIIHCCQSLCNYHIIYHLNYKSKKGCH